MRFKGVEIKCFIDQKKQQLAKRQAAKTRGKAPRAKTFSFPPITEQRVHRVHALAGTAASFELQGDSDRRLSASGSTPAGRHLFHLHSPLQSQEKAKK